MVQAVNNRGTPEGTPPPPPLSLSLCVSVVCVCVCVLSSSTASVNTQVGFFTAAVLLLLANQAKRRGRADFQPPSSTPPSSSPLPSLVYCAAERSRM